MRKKGSKYNFKEDNSKPIIKTGVAQQHIKERREENKKSERIGTKAKRKQKKNSKRIEGKRKERKKKTQNRKCLDPYQNQGV